MQSNNSAREQNALIQNGIPYKIQKDGFGNEHKVVDLDYPGLVPREGIVIIEATTRKNAERANDIPFKMTVDKLSKVAIGICEGIDNERKTLKWRTINLGRTTMFNLEIKEEAEAAWCLQRSNMVVGSPNLSSNIYLGLFRVHDQLKAATNNMKRILDAQRAIEIAKGLTGEDLINMGRNLGVNVDHTNAIIILDQVLTRAEKNPTEFLTLYENPNREQVTIFKRGLESGVITYDPITGYHFRGVNLGINEPLVIEYFNKFKDVQGSIDMASRERLKKPTVAKTEVLDPEKEELKKQLAELQAKLAKPSEDLQAERDALVAEAKELKIQSPHLTTATRESIDKLKAKIDEAKKVTTT